MSRFFFGQIVAAYIDDGRGRTNERPAVIISEAEDPASGEILVIPITKRPSLPCPYYHVQVHDDTSRDPDTGLYYPCWAKCNWARWIETRRINATWGQMPDDLLWKIVDIYDLIYADDPFADWQ